MKTPKTNYIQSKIKPYIIELLTIYKLKVSYIQLATEYLFTDEQTNTTL